MFDWYISDPVAKPRILVACKDAYLSVELFGLFTKLFGTPVDTAQFNTTYPGDAVTPNKYDVLILTFEPVNDAEYSWYHGFFLTHLAPGGKVINTN